MCKLLPGDDSGTKPGGGHEASYGCSSPSPLAKNETPCYSHDASFEGLFFFHSLLQLLDGVLHHEVVHQHGVPACLESIREPAARLDVELVLVGLLHRLDDTTVSDDPDEVGQQSCNYSGEDCSEHGCSFQRWGLIISHVSPAII